MPETVAEYIALAVEFAKNLTANVVAQQNATAPAKDAPAKTPATAEGMALAYGCISVMAVLPIFFGSFRSVNHQKKQKVSKNADACCKTTTTTSSI